MIDPESYGAVSRTFKSVRQKYSGLCRSSAAFGSNASECLSDRRHAIIHVLTFKLFGQFPPDLLTRTVAKLCFAITSKVMISAVGAERLDIAYAERTLVDRNWISKAAQWHASCPSRQKAACVYAEFRD